MWARTNSIRNCRLTEMTQSMIVTGTICHVANPPDTSSRFTCASLAHSLSLSELGCEFSCHSHFDSAAELDRP